MPVPVSVTSNAAPTAMSLLAMCSAAVFAPAAVAENCTIIVVVAPTAMALAGALVTVKLAAFVPSIVTPVMLSEVLLSLRIVKVFVAVLPTFIDVSGRVLGQTVLLSVTYVGIATILHAMIVTLAGTARHLLLAEPHFALLFRRGLALGLAGIAIWFAVGTAQA